MSVLKYFKNTPGRPPIGRQALSVIFLIQICNEVPGKKKGPVAPPPTGDRGGLSPPGRPGYPPIKAPALPFPPHLSPKISPKIQKKKRGVRRRKAAKPCRIQHL